jgi:hypothetical protein
MEILSIFMIGSSHLEQLFFKIQINGNKNRRTPPYQRREKKWMDLETKMKPQFSILYIFHIHNSMISWGINAPSALQCILLYLSQSLTLVCHRARFCRGVTELQITGLVRMPSKRRPDFVQRIAFGIWIQNSLVYFPPVIY